MPSFSIASDGRLRDESAERVVDHALQEFPWLNGGGLSLYIALSKAYWDSSAQFADYCAAFDLSIRPSASTSATNVDTCRPSALLR